MATVLVIGASRGIGLEFARQYAAAGDRVIATARTDGSSQRVRRTAWSSALAAPTRTITCFGTISRCTGACGWMSCSTMQCSSSCSILAGISRSMIF